MTNEIVDLNKLPSNSRVPKHQEVIDDGEKKVNKIITGKIIKKEKGFLDKFSETFFGDDAKTVVNYVIWDVLIPAAKNTVSDMIQTGVDMLLFGESRGSHKKLRRDRDRSFVSYGSFYSGRSEGRDRQVSRTRSRYDFSEIIFDNRGEAEEVLSALAELIDKYEYASVSDFYALVGEDSEFTDEKYGWLNITRARVERTRYGYVIMLPRPIALE